MKVDAASLAAKRAEVAANPGDMRARLDFARMLGAAEQFDEATEAHVWFWEHVLEYDREFRGVRRSFFITYLQMLISRYEPARGAITTLRDRIAPPRDREPDVEAFADWACLNEALGDADATLGWFDDVYTKLSSSETLEALLERFVVPLLSAANRLADYGAVVRDPLATLARAAKLRARVEEGAAASQPSVDLGFRDFIAAQFRTTAASLVRALHSAGRDVAAVTDEARRLDPSEDMSTALAAALS